MRAPPRAAATARAAGLALALAASLGLGCVAPGGPSERLVVERPYMGTTFRIVVHARDGAAVRAALEEAFAAVAAVEAWASDWNAESEVRRLAASAETAPRGTALPISAALAEHLAFALDLASETDGAFDPTLGTLTRLWRRSARMGELPSEARLAEARARSGWRTVTVDAGARTARFDVPGTRLDLGGSAKGEALDRAFAVLAAAGFPCALVDGGGDLRVGAPPPGTTGWHVTLEPLGSGHGALRFEAAHCAIATSGAAARAFELEGVRYSHILNPSTGLGLTTPRAATVIAPDARTADALATALVVAGEPGLALSAGRAGCAGALFEPPREPPSARPRLPACASPGFPQDGGLVLGAAADPPVTAR